MIKSISIKNVTLFITLLFVKYLAYSQHNKIVVGEFCYYEQINGQKSQSEAMPYTYHSKLELKFKSGYQITVKDIKGFKDLIKSYSPTVVSSKILLGEYKPESISKGIKLIDMKSTINVYWDGKNLILDIPELTDMFSDDSVSNHTVFIPKDCIQDFIICLKE